MHRQYTNAEKIEFLDAVQRNGGILLDACRSFKISRTTHYEWLKKEKWYKQLYDDIMEEQKDFVESQLLKNIKEGEKNSIIFYLKTKAKDRGYFEKVQNENTHNFKGRAFQFVDADSNPKENGTESS